jgi:hypothetical protein
MDGVLCDFKTAAVRDTGLPIEQWMQSGGRDKASKWKPIIDNKRFWYTLPWQPGGQQLWSVYKQLFTTYIISIRRTRNRP